jgi:transcription initiation factor TFIIE subunit alpha
MNDLKSEELVRELIERVAGDVGLIIWDMKPKETFTDEELSIILGIEINDVRRALFSLYELGLAEYRRKRDEDTGWIEYHWKVRFDRQRDVLRRELTKAKMKLEEKIRQETENIYYLCENGCVKVKYEEAMELNFLCPKCGGILEYLDSSSAVEKVMDEIRRLDEILLEL